MSICSMDILLCLGPSTRSEYYLPVETPLHKTYSHPPGAIDYASFSVYSMSSWTPSHFLLWRWTVHVLDWHPKQQHHIGIITSWVWLSLVSRRHILSDTCLYLTLTVILPYNLITWGQEWYSFPINGYEL